LKDCLNLTIGKVLSTYYKNPQSSTIIALELECSGRDRNTNLPVKNGYYMLAFLVFDAEI
jgi:hypothetical protein